MSNPTHKKPPVSDGDAELCRIVNRAGVTTTIKEALDEIGAASYPGAVPYVEKLIRPKIEPKALKLEAFIKNQVTPEVFQQAVLLHAAHVAEQRKNKAAQPELFHDQE